MDDELLGFLDPRDETYCFRCLTQAFPRVRVPNHLEAAQQRGTSIIMADGRCAIYARSTTVTAYVTGDPGLTRFGD